MRGVQVMRLAEKLARCMWEADGKPDGAGLGESNLGTYRDEADRVLRALAALGLRVVRAS